MQTSGNGKESIIAATMPDPILQFFVAAYIRTTLVDET
jgi:hypothetical protein